MPLQTHGRRGKRLQHLPDHTQKRGEGIGIRQGWQEQRERPLADLGRQGAGHRAFRQLVQGQPEADAAASGEKPQITLDGDTPVRRDPSFPFPAEGKNPTRGTVEYGPARTVGRRPARLEESPGCPRIPRERRRSAPRGLGAHRGFHILVSWSQGSGDSEFQGKGREKAARRHGCPRRLHVIGQKEAFFQKRALPRPLEQGQLPTGNRLSRIVFAVSLQNEGSGHEGLFQFAAELPGIPQFFLTEGRMVPFRRRRFFRNEGRLPALREHHTGFFKEQVGKFPLRPQSGKNPVRSCHGSSQGASSTAVIVTS